MTSAPTAAKPRIPGAVAIGRRRITIEFKQFFRDRDSAIWNFSLPVLLLTVFAQRQIVAGLTDGAVKGG